MPTCPGAAGVGTPEAEVSAGGGARGGGAGGTIEEPPPEAVEPAGGGANGGTAGGASGDGMVAAGLVELDVDAAGGGVSGVAGVAGVVAAGAVAVEPGGWSSGDIAPLSGGESEVDPEPGESSRSGGGSGGMSPKSRPSPAGAWLNAIKAVKAITSARTSFRIGDPPDDTSQRPHPQRTVGAVASHHSKKIPLVLYYRPTWFSLSTFFREYFSKCKKSEKYMRTQVVVIGGGHAGCEAALASVRLGAETLLLTMDPDKICHVSCNPAIGGVAKGQLVREIDALGGMMGMAADSNALQFRMLNSSKGPAVRSPRAQVDRWAYQHWVKDYLERQPNLAIRLDQAVGLDVRDGRVVGVRTFFGETIQCDAVIVCSGTFARGKLHLGEKQWAGGRAGEPPAPYLSEALMELGLPLFRLRTGTCPRLDARTVDFDRMQPEEGDAEPGPFSFLTEKIDCPQMRCYATWTNDDTFRIVHDNLHLSPLITGAVAGASPRYCPNFETKVASFPEKRKHHLFVEPEGARSSELYLNGLYLSMPPELQEAIIHTIPGLERARIVRYGYSVEYDAIRSTELRDTLETKRIAGLFTAGQVNGTSGYEEAAAQGLLAGANAGLMALGRPAFRLGRDQAYIGVLVDDLTIRGTDEPYRLFTSRAEYRLLLRQDNADLRLTRLGAEIGLLDGERLARVEKLAAEMDAGRAVLRNIRDASGNTLEQLLRRPEMNWADIASGQPGLEALSARAAEQLTIETKYDGYIARHLRQIGQLEKHRRLRIPETFDYSRVNGLSREAAEKLALFRPENLDQAMRISGVSPADAALLLVRMGSK